MSLWSLINPGSAVFLIAAIAILSFKNPVIKVGIIVLTALMLKFRPGFDAENIIFIASLFAALILKGILPFRQKANAVIAVIGSFILFNIGIIFL
jgi:hypothetical protein